MQLDRVVRSPCTLVCSLVSLSWVYYITILHPVNKILGLLQTVTINTLVHRTTQETKVLSLRTFKNKSTPGAVSRLKFTHLPMGPPTRPTSKNNQQHFGCQSLTQSHPPHTTHTRTQTTPNPTKKVDLPHHSTPCYNRPQEDQL